MYMRVFVIRISYLTEMQYSKCTYTLNSVEHTNETSFSFRFRNLLANSIVTAKVPRFVIGQH